MADSLRSKTLRALSWTFLEAVGLRGTQFIVVVVLARLLEPGEFGLIGMLAVFMAVAQSLLDSGFGAALIQKRDVTRADTCSIFYFNIVVGFMVAGLLCIAAPGIALFFKEPLLTPLTRVLSAVVVINSFALVQNTVLTRELNFKALTKVNLGANVLSGVTGISLAAAGFGVWSLVFQQVFKAFFTTLFLWLANPWRPALVFSLGALRRMFGFGSRVMASGLLNTFFDNIYSPVIGKLFSAQDLGLFTQAKRVQELPVQSLSWTVGRVTFPVFSSIQDNRVRLKRGLKSVLTSLAFLNFPVMIGILVTARPLVLCLLTEKWVPCVPYLQLLCIVGLLHPVQWFAANVLYAMGRSGLCFRLDLFKKVLVAVNISVTWRWGIEAMIWGQVVVSVISCILNCYYNGALIDYPIKEQLRDLWPYTPVPVLMGVGVYLVGYAPVSNTWLLLVTQVAAGVALYAGMSWFMRLPKFLEVTQMALTKLRSWRAAGR